jgi:exosortase/archaeosortase family protein
MKASALNKTTWGFFIKLFAIILLWEFSYHLILKPARIPDGMLTNVITSGVTKGLNLFFSAANPYTWIENPGLTMSSLLQNGKPIFLIYDDCNGLDLIAIYLLLIILLPYPVKRKIIFGLGGIVVIIIANILRCIALYWIYRRYRYMFEFNHHYTFTIFMYIIIFYGWILFTKKGKKNEVH